MSLIFKESDHKQDFNSFKEISEAEKDKVLSNLNKMPMTFITNEGQVDSKVKYYAKVGNFGLYFTKEEVVLSFITGTTKKSFNKNSNKDNISKEEEKSIGLAHALHFIDANPNVKIVGQAKGAGRINYLKGNDPEKWYTDLSTYKKVVYKEIWKGIDLVFYGGRDQLKYEFVVHPGADFQDIMLRYNGANDITLDEDGNLLIKNEFGVLIDECPISYQEIDGKKIEIDSKFIVEEQDNKESTYSFEIEKCYNPDYPLIIDPGLVYSTYLGGSSNEEGRGIVIDNTGSAYVTGQTTSTDFPTTPGAFQTALNGPFDAFVTKLNADGTSLIYSTYLGGSSVDSSNAIAVDTTGCAYVTGQTRSGDFPTTAGAFQTAIAGNDDAFVTKLNATGTGLIYSTYLGGSTLDQGFGIVVDNTGNAYVTGNTLSADFPTTVGSFQPVFGGGTSDAFVTRLNATGTGLIYSTFLGGSGSDSGVGIAIDNTGSAYVTGLTNSGDFPTTAGAFQTTFGGIIDVFITKLNAIGSSLIYSTYLGGSSADRSSGITIDNSGSAYVTGATGSADFPTTAGAFQPVFGGLQDAFVTKLNAEGTGLIYSTFIGGSSSDAAEGIVIDNTGSAYVTGNTSSVDFPTTVGAFQSAITGGGDAFVTKLNATGTGLIYSTYLGGSSSDVGFGIAVDNIGSAYVTGVTSSTDFPTTLSAVQTALEGSSDAFVTKINTNTVSPKIRITNQNITAIVYETG